MGHIVIDGVPRGAKTAGFTVWIIWNDVDAGNLGNGVHREVVIGNTCSCVIGEEATEAYY